MKCLQPLVYVMLATAPAAWGQALPSPARPVIAVPSAAATPLARAEVLNVYPKERRVLLRHDAIPSLGMSAMTMEFGLAEPGMLKGLRKGSRIRFMAIREADDYLITRIEVPK